jgi:hypothetical protein
MRFNFEPLSDKSSNKSEIDSKEPEHQLKGGDQAHLSKNEIRQLAYLFRVFKKILKSKLTKEALGGSNNYSNNYLQNK